MIEMFLQLVELILRSRGFFVVSGHRSIERLLQIGHLRGVLGQRCRILQCRFQFENLTIGHPGRWQDVREREEEGQ